MKKIVVVFVVVFLNTIFSQVSAQTKNNENDTTVVVSSNCYDNFEPKVDVTILQVFRFIEKMNMEDIPLSFDTKEGIFCLVNLDGVDGCIYTIALDSNKYNQQYILVNFKNKLTRGRSIMVADLLLSSISTYPTELEGFNLMPKNVGEALQIYFNNIAEYFERKSLF